MYKLPGWQAAAAGVMKDYATEKTREAIAKRKAAKAAAEAKRLGAKKKKPPPPKKKPEPKVKEDGLEEYHGDGWMHLKKVTYRRSFVPQYRGPKSNLGDPKTKEAKWRVTVGFFCFFLFNFVKRGSSKALQPTTFSLLFSPLPKKKIK